MKLKKENTDKVRKDWWEALGRDEKASIRRGLDDEKAGRVVAHEQILKKYRKWL